MNFYNRFKVKSHLSYYGILLISYFISFESKAEDIHFKDSDRPCFQFIPEKNSGLDKIFVLYDLNNVKLTYKTQFPNKVNISTFSEKGISFSSPVEDYSIYGDEITIEKLSSDTGYIIEDGSQKTILWVIDYSKYRYNITNISPSSEIDCESTNLTVIGDASPIYYYSINGKRQVLPRDIILSFNTISFNETEQQFIEENIQKNIAYISENISITPPVFAVTEFKIEGDQFLKFWNEYESLTSDIYTPSSTIVYTKAIQQTDNNSSQENSNIISNGDDSLGGSAPVTISFEAYVNEAVIHNEWQIANDADFEEVLYRINQQDFDYTFTKEGKSFIRYIGSNFDGSCQSIGEVYTVNIGISELLIPNAFSPNGDGINDIWKVSFRSLIEFKCSIFDRNGHEVYSFDDPSQGWDGKINGNTATSGVYFYVIQAKGADGKKYKRSGDINILKSKINNVSSSN